jgi:hypothetical protein
MADADEQLEAARHGTLVGGDGPADPQAEAIAQRFHEAYERLAPAHGYETREASAVPWESVPHQNKRLMTAVVRELLDSGAIVVGVS